MIAGMAPLDFQRAADAGERFLPTAERYRAYF